MAKVNTTRKKTLSMKDRTSFWTDISYIPSEDKNEVWAAQMIYFAKKNGKLFLDPKRAKLYRATDNLEIDESVYKKMVDPVTPLGGGGTAEFFNADWKANPIYIHLKNIVKANIQRTSKQLEVNLTDKYAKTRKMRDNYRILYQGLFRDLINEYAPMVGLKPISGSQDPFKWAKSFIDQQTKGKDKGDASKQPKPESQSDIIDNFSDLIKNQITNNEDLALYNELIYKGDYEMAFEKGIEHYMMNQNKWIERYSDVFLDDIMHFNKACGEFYTDLVSGRPIIERFIPEELFVSPFKQKDGEDLMYYFIEYEITFANFVKTIGKDLSPEQLKKVFQYNKTQGSAHGTNWIDDINRPNRVRDSANIRVGRMSCLTQDCQAFVAELGTGYDTLKQADLSWSPLEDSNEKREERHYNVWYSWYYLPPTTNSLSNADYAWQAQFVFNIKKNQDQFRTGEDGRYTKSPLVIYDNSKQASFTDIIQFWMPKIHHATHKYQNCLINDLDATVLSDELIGGLLAAADEDNNINGANPNKPTGGNGRDAYMQQWKMIKQNGVGFLKMTDKQGVPVLDPAKLQMTFKNGKLESAEKYMKEIMNMYSMMTASLAMSDAAEGGEVKPRTAVAALNESLKSSNNAQWFIQMAYECFLKTYAERFVHYILMSAQEAKKYGFTKRFDEFKSVVGEANGLMVEGMEDVEPESVGLTVNYVDNASKKDFVMQLALERVKNGALDDDFIYLIMGADNWKVSFALMRVGIQKRKREAVAQAQVQQENIMQQKAADLQTAQALNKSKADGKDQNIMTEGNVQAMINDQTNKLKADTMATQKEQIKNNRIQQDQNKSELNKDEKEHAVNLEHQAAV